jgi:hypothetical protein
MGWLTSLPKRTQASLLARCPAEWVASSVPSHWQPTAEAKAASLPPVFPLQAGWRCPLGLVGGERSHTRAARTS